MTQIAAMPVFARWRKTALELIRMQDKSDWDGLDLLSKWFIATRSAVGTITLYSSVIGGLLAWQYDAANGVPFSFLTWAILTAGLFVAHGTNNLLNDYVDFVRGVDKNNFRVQYGVHPLAQAFWSEPTHLRWVAFSGVLAALSGIYALVITDFAPPVLWLIVAGGLILVFYTYPLKWIGVGELSIFFVWGPMMVGGVYYVLTQTWDAGVLLASIPIGLSITTINLGKHIDKLEEDARKGVGTLPVLVGDHAARMLTIAAIVLAHAVTIVLIFIMDAFTPLMLAVLLAYRPAIAAITRLSQPRPSVPPPGYPIWPRWFSTVCFVHNRAFSNLFVLALLAGIVVRAVLS